MVKYFLSNDSTTFVDSQIDAVLKNMQTIGVTDSEYPRMLDYLERLAEIKKNERRNPVSRDTIALIAGNLMGILVIVAYEQKHVMTSQGFKQIIRPR